MTRSRKRKRAGGSCLKSSPAVTTSGQDGRPSTSTVSGAEKSEAVITRRSRRRKAAVGVVDKLRADVVATSLQYGQLNAVTQSMSVPQSEYLCDRCSRIDFDRAFARVYKPLDLHGDLVLDLGEVDTWDTSCVFCKLMSSIIPVTGPGAGAPAHVSNLQLRSYFGEMYQAFRCNDLIAKKTVCLGIASRQSPYPSAFIVSQTGPKDIVRQLRCDWIDYGIILGWLKYCRSHHTVNCAIDERKPVKYLKLIDCRTRKIIVAGDQPYVTLSYVWGKALDCQRHNDTLPDGLPMTIEDSIKVAIALGFQYIWIDRYCIEQSRPTQVRHQVGLMDLIYSNSELTIIAAAGEDPCYGLPGVSNRARATQQAGKVGNRLLLSTMNEPTQAISNSVWNTRGWTYQEGLLARRRLVFTDQQIYFECHSMYCSEALNLSLDGLHCGRRQAFESRYCSRKGIGIFPRGIGSQQWSILDRIHEYTMRTMTNEADILKGFMGVMRVFRSSTIKVESIYGIPFLLRRSTTLDTLSPRPTSLPQFDSDVLKSSFAKGLMWHASPTTRRAEFPSWSWSGWDSPVSWDSEGSRICSLRRNAELEIRLRRTGSSKWLDFRSALEDIILQDLDVSKSIMIKAPFVMIGSICKDVVARAPWCQARTQLQTGGYVEWSFNPTTQENLRLQDCIAISVQQYLRFDRVLVLKRVGLVWERVGIGILGPFYDTTLCNREGICELDRHQIESMGWERFKSLYGIGVDVDWFELI